MIPEYLVLPEIEAQHNEVHRKLYKLSFCILPEIAVTPPTIDTLSKGFGQFYNDTATGTKRLYVNLDGNLFYLEGKNV